MSATMTPRAQSRSPAESTAERLLPYVPRLVVGWARDEPDRHWKSIDSTLAFIDISGFTSMTERLARKGKVGAEEMNDVLNALFGELLAVAYDDGAGLVKWGGDAGLLLFDGPDHAARAARAAINMQKTIREIGRIKTSVGQVRLRMSIGMHSGEFDFFLVGDADIHRELVLAGPASTMTVLMEQTAEAGEVAVSAATAALLDERALGDLKDEAVLLRAAPDLGPPVGHKIRVPGDEDLAALIPVAIREHLLTGDDHPEHRRITAAFLEFVGSDDMYAREGPQTLGEAIDTCVRLVQRAALDHGVSFFETDVARNAWRIMMIAGAPRNLGGDEDRMLATLRTIIETDLPFPVKIGTNGGHVFAGHFGPPFRRTYSVKGDAVNTSARIMAKTEPGKIYASAAVLEPATALYETDELEPFAAKGKKKPLQAWSVGKRIGSKASELELPLVGREPELQTFVELLEDARAGRGGAVELVGPPGIGKTRLLAELMRKADDLHNLRALCEAYQQQIAYRPFRALLRAALDIPRNAPNASGAKRLRERVETLSPQLLPWLPLLGTVTDIEVSPTTQVDELGDQFKRSKLEEVTVEFMSALLTEPTLLVIEDVHWVDDGSAGLLARMSAEIVGRPWMLAVTRRPQTTGFVLAEQDRSRSLLVHPLEPAEAESLVIAATDAQPLRRHDIDALKSRAAGNPLFLTQLLTGVLRTGSAEDLPLTVESLVTAEIDRLPRQDQLVLRVAAVLGMEVSEQLAWSLLELEDDEVDPAVWTRLAEFLEPSAHGHRRFRHALMREAAYEGLPYRRRRELHARAGVMIIADSDDPAEQAELLSHHFSAAYSHFDSWAYSIIAGQRARSKYANSAAAAFFARAIDSGRRARVEPSALAEVHEQLGHMRVFLNEFEEARAAYAAGRHLVRDDIVAQARFLLHEARAHYRGGRLSDAVRSLRRGMRLLEPHEDHETERVRIRLASQYAGMRVAQGRLKEAEELCQRIIASSAGVDEPWALGTAYTVLDDALVQQGRIEEAAYLDRAVELFERAGDLSNMAEAISNMGVVAYDRGDWDRAISLYEQSGELRRRLGDDGEAAISAANIAEIRLDQGRLADAETLLVEASRAHRASGYLIGVAFVTMLLGRAAAQGGRFNQALEDLTSARLTFNRVGYSRYTLEADAWIAQTRLASGDAPGALADAEAALATAAKEAAEGSRVPLLHRIRAFALLELGRPEDAVEALCAAHAAARRRAARYEVAVTLEALARLELLPLNDAVAAAAEAAPILAALGVVDVPGLPTAITPRATEVARGA